MAIALRLFSLNTQIFLFFTSHLPIIFVCFVNNVLNNWSLKFCHGGLKQCLYYFHVYWNFWGILDYWSDNIMIIVLCMCQSRLIWSIFIKWIYGYWFVKMSNKIHICSGVLCIIQWRRALIVELLTLNNRSLLSEVLLSLTCNVLSHYHLHPAYFIFPCSFDRLP